jgi:hypothetical protein
MDFIRKAHGELKDVIFYCLQPITGPQAIMVKKSFQNSEKTQRRRNFLLPLTNYWSAGNFLNFKGRRVFYRWGLFLGTALPKIK